MDDIRTLARPYAVAAFKHAQEEGSVAAWADMLALLSVVAGDPTVKGLIAHPKVGKVALEGLILDVCGDALSATGKNFTRLLVENGRLNLVEEIEVQFARERAKVEGRRDVTVVSAFELSDAEREDLIQKVSKRLGAEVELTVSIDARLIGGVIITAGDMVIDASLRGRLAQMASAL